MPFLSLCSCLAPCLLAASVPGPVTREPEAWSDPVVTSVVLATPRSRAADASRADRAAQGAPEPTQTPDAAPAGEPPQSAPSAEAEVAIEADVIENILTQPLGTGTVADLALPDDFLARVADRIVRTSYAERYRVVVPDAVVEEARKKFEEEQRLADEAADGTAGTDPAASSVPGAVPPPGAPPAEPEGRGFAALAFSLLALALFGVVALIVVRSSRRSAS